MTIIVHNEQYVLACDFCLFVIMNSILDKEIKLDLTIHPFEGIHCKWVLFQRHYIKSLKVNKWKYIDNLYLQN